MIALPAICLLRKSVWISCSNSMAINRSGREEVHSVVVDYLFRIAIWQKDCSGKEKLLSFAGKKMAMLFVAPGILFFDIGPE